MSQIERTIRIDVPLASVFAFFTDIRNHSRLALPKSREELLDPGDIPLRMGTIVRLRARYGGLYWTLAARITAFEPPGDPHKDRAYFRDEQVRGPFSVWRHDHLFEALPEGGVRLTDRILFAAPFGPIGRLVELIWLNREIRGLMAHLQETAKHILETETA